MPDSMPSSPPLLQALPVLPLSAVLFPGGSLDLTLNQVNAVPEPGMLALAGAGLFGALGTIRRRKAK